MNERVTIHDIHKRLRGLNRSDYDSTYINIYEHNVENSIRSKNPKNIMRSIILSGQCGSVQLESVLELYDTLYECGTTGQMNKMANYICEEVVPKVRDAKETNTNLRRKLGRIKTKITTKINNNIQDMHDTVMAKIHAAQGNFQSNTQEIKNNINKGLHPIKSKQEQNAATKKNEAYINNYEKISKTLDKYIECDRILENYNRISRRYNLEKIIIENTRRHGYQDTVNELCRFIDTYAIPNPEKYSIAIETAWYGFEQNGIEYDKKEMLEAASDYFLMKKNGLNDCQTVMKNSVIFDPREFPDHMQVITEINPKDNPPEGVFQTINTINKDVMENIGESEFITVAITEATDFNKIFNDFKDSEDEHKETKLNMLVRKLYTKNVTNIVEETPNFLNWIRRVLVLGTFAIHPVVGAISVIGDIFAQLHFERNETEKMMKCFDNEIKKSQTKLKDTTDPEEKARLKAYIDSLNKVKIKIDDYYDRMLTDKEIDAKYSDDNEDVPMDSFDDLKSDILEDDDDDWDDWDDDDDDNLLEGAIMAIDTVSDYQDRFAEYNRIGMDTITHMDIFNADDIDAISKLSVEYPDVWAPELVEAAIENQVAKIRKGKITFESAMDRFQTLNAYDTGLKNLHTYKPRQPITNGDCIQSLVRLVEAAEAINSIIYTYDNRNVMVEASFMNSLKLASEKLKKTIQTLSDKDRTISKNVDVSLSQFKKSMENTLTNENREAVIKGSVLPSASKIIKLAIASAGLSILINPTIAVITALGYLGLSAKHKIKERQLILDELDVELKMCEKYIEIAESKNDMKALKQLLMIQKNLKRQEQRIRYKMKVDFNQNAPKTDD